MKTKIHTKEIIGAKWSDSLKKLKSHRISPFIEPQLKKSAKQAILSLVSKPVEAHTPELSINEENSSGYSSDISSCFEPSDSVSQIIQTLLEDEISSSDDEEEDVMEQAMAHLLQQKSQTCPELAALDRPLPPLPDTDESEYDEFSKSLELCNTAKDTLLKRVATTRATSQVQLKRAATWLGLPVQKLFASPKVQNLIKYHSTVNFLTLGKSSQNIPVYASEEDDEKAKDDQALTKEVIYGTDSDHFEFLRNQLENKRSPAQASKKIVSSNKKTFVTPKRIMYCRVMQIINLASTRDCDYELHIQLNNVTMATKKGVLRKIEKNVSADRPQEEALVFEVEEPFSLNFIVAARHANTFLRDGLAKLGIWPIHEKKETHEELPVAGFTCLNFENKMDVLDQGVSRFRLTKPIDKSSDRWLNIELLIDIKVEEVLPAVVHRFPWSYTTNEYSASSYQSSTEDVISDPKELLVSQNHCRQGDYLTVYTRGLAHPTWKRYWVTMEDNQLVLHNFTYKESKEPASIIPLIPLQAVSKPSLDDCENVGIARKTGILLQFDRSKAMLTEPVRLDCDEGLEGKAYLFGDSEESTIHWRRALSSYITDENNRNASSGDGVDLRFLW